MTTSHNRYPVDLNADASSDDIDLSKLFGFLLDGKWIIIVTTFLFTAAGVAMALLSTPIYIADALIQIEEKSSGGISSLVGEVGEFFTPKSSAMTEIEIIKSRKILTSTVNKFNLTIVTNPKYVPFVGKGWARLNGMEDHIDVTHYVIAENAQETPHELLVLDAQQQTYQLIREDEQEQQVVLEGKVGELVKNEGYELFVSELDSHNLQRFTIGLRSQLSAIEWLKQNLTLNEKGKQTGILQLSFIGENPKRNIEILDHISQTYFLQNVARDAEQAEKSLQFLNEQLPSIRDNLTVAEDALNRFRQQSESVDLGLEAQATLNTMVNIEAQLNELSFQESEIRQRFTKDHPTYKSVLNKRQALLKERARLERQIQKLPKTQREVLRYTRDVEVNQQIYIQLLNKVQELNVIKAGTVGNVRILDAAQSFAGPIKPKKSLIVVFSLLFGGILSVVMVLLRAAFHRGVENPEEIEKIGIPVYASIPKSNQQLTLAHKLARKRGARSELVLLAETSPADLAVEALRGLRTGLHFAMLDEQIKKNNVLMISGPVANIGKSFISANFAAVAVKTGQRVLIIDADMRKGYMQQWFGLKWDDGLSDLLSGKIAVEQAAKATQVANLDIITRGQIPPNPSELLMHSRFRQLIEWASEHYDLVIIDTPPVLAVTDASIIGGSAGTTLMVVRFGQNTIKEIDLAYKRFDQSGVKVKGVILNMVEKKASTIYGYYPYSYAQK